MEDHGNAELPILTDIVELRSHPSPTGRHRVLEVLPEGDTGLHSAEELAALQADLVARALTVTDELLHGAAREMEGLLFERVLDRLRAALPEIVSMALKEHLGPRNE